MTGTVVLALHAKGKPVGRADEGGGARVRFASRRARRFAGTVTYEWEASAETPGHFPALERNRALGVGGGAGHRSLRSPGRSSSMRPRGRGVSGTRHRPTGVSRSVCPWRGGFDALQMRYRRERTRIGAGPGRDPHRALAPKPGVSLRARASADAVGGVLAPDPGRPAAHRRRGARDSSCGDGAPCDPSRREVLWIWTRGSSASSWGTGAMVGSRSQPLPNVGYLHADGRIRRVLLVAPEWVDGDAWRSVVSRARGRGARRGGERRGGRHAGAASRSRIRCSPGTVGRGGVGRARPRWCCRGTTACGAGCAPERSVRKLLRHAGVAEALLERAAFRARVAASRERSPAVVPSPGAPRAVSVPAPQRRVDGPGPGPARARRRRRVRVRAPRPGGRRIPLSLVEVTLKEVESACVGGEGDGIHSGLRT